MLTDVHKAAGAVYGDAFGTSYPLYFVHPGAEYQAITKYLGLIDLNHWSVLSLTGKDRVSFLNNMITNDIAGLEPGHGAHSVFTTVKGKIISELFVFVREDDVLILVAQGDAAETKTTLEKHIIMDDVTLIDLSDDYGVLALEGAPKKVDEMIWRLFPKGPFPKERLLAWARDFEGTSLYVMRNNVAGEDGYHLLVPKAKLEQLWHYMVQGGRGSDGLPVGSIAWNLARVERGLPWWGVDFDGNNFPDEARLGHTIDYDKGCYRGQETLARLHHRGHVNRLLVGLTPAAVHEDRILVELAESFSDELDNYDESGLHKASGALAESLKGAALLAAGTELFADLDDEKAVGNVSSAVFSPRLGKPLYLAMVRHGHVESGKPLFDNDGLELELVELPLTE